MKTKDKKLSFLIKYFSFKNINKIRKRKNFNKNDFFVIHNDSLFIIAHNNNNEKNSKNEKMHRTKYKHNNFILNRYGEYLNELNINYSSKNIEKKN